MKDESHDRHVRYLIALANGVPKDEAWNQAGLLPERIISKKPKHRAEIQRLSEGWQEKEPNTAELVDKEIHDQYVKQFAKQDDRTAMPVHELTDAELAQMSAAREWVCSEHIPEPGAFVDVDKLPDPKLDRARVIRPGHAYQSLNPKQKYGDAKVALHLIPAAGLIYTAVAMKEGAEKYGPFNWRKDHVEGMTYVGAVLRHVLAWVDGEDMDPDGKGNKPHLAGALASLHILVDAIEGKFLIDNRPPKGPAAKLLSDNANT